MLRRPARAVAAAVSIASGHSRFSEGDGYGIAFRKRTKPSPRAARLREHLPALAQHLREVSVQLLHAEESLPMVGSVPGSFVGVGFDLHLNPVPSTHPET
jgi:hypothetical protein